MNLVNDKKIAVIIGAGPAGLTAALEFCRRSEVHPIVLEASERMGGISCTIQHNGNRIDIGGHRFFSKSDRVMNWWASLMPVVDDGVPEDLTICYQNKRRLVSAKGRCADPDHVMLVRERKSRIYFMRSFFDYPLSLSAGTLMRLGVVRTLRIGVSYLWARLMPRKHEKTLEDFFINRFGRELYLTFFKSYTEKVWGVPCDEISAEWGAQRIKGLSLRSAVTHFVKKLFKRSGKQVDIRQKDAETSLIERFLYPKYGPGQLWERAADLVRASGGEIRTGCRVKHMHIDMDDAGNGHVRSVEAVDVEGRSSTITGDYFFSTMPIRELLRMTNVAVPEAVQAISNGLAYRDFITVGLLVDRLLIQEEDGSPIKDTWIYIQEPDVLLGRLQIFNNWSPYLVSDLSKVWIGLEYFCYDKDALWNSCDEEIIRFAIGEVAKIGILRADEVRDSCVFRVPKTYPAYFGTYSRFDEIIQFTERFENLFLVGRNGMHKYNNQDHSMLTAMVAVDNVLAGIKSKANLWAINTEQEYHEEKNDAQPVESATSPESGSEVNEDEEIAA